MLIACVPHPNIYDYKLFENKYYCECLCGLLDMILSNGIILVDKEHKYIEAVEEYIQKWPKNDKYNKIKRKLKLLNDSGRIVCIDFNISRTEVCATKEECKIFHSLLQSSDIRAIIPEWCNKSNEKYARLSGFNGSILYEELCKRSELYDKGNENKFEDEVLIPFLKYCKSVKIIDRVFSEHISSKTDYDIKKEYKEGFENIINIIKNYNINTSKVNVELYVAFKHNIGNQMSFSIIQKKLIL